jgi:phage terminase small subunit
MSSDANLNKKSTDLNKKQAIFVKEYLVDFNATRSAVAAGYSKKTAEAAASRLLRNVKVRAAVEQETSQRCEKLGVDADQILTELQKLAYSNMLDYITIQEGDAYVDFSRLTREHGAAMHEITSETYREETGEYKDGKPVKRTVKRTKFKLHDKRGALELLGRHKKLFTDKLDVKLNGVVTLDPTQRLERLTQLLALATEGRARKAK